MARERHPLGEVIVAQTSHALLQVGLQAKEGLTELLMALVQRPVKIFDEHLIVGAERYLGAGFSLSVEPANINLLEIIETIQGPVRLNRCLLDEDSCLRRSGCRIHDTLASLQGQVAQFLTGTTLANVCNGTGGDANSGKSDKRSDK